MGLRCSVLGHDYGDPEVRREREERGSEVLVTVREVETCGRCDSERVTSENKEVTSITDPPERPAPGSASGTGERPGTDGATDADATPSSTDPSPARSESSSPPSPAEEDAEIIDADAAAGVTESDTDSAGDTGAAAAPEEGDATDEAARVIEDEPADTAVTDDKPEDTTVADEPADTDAADEPDVPVREAESSAQTTLGDAAGSAATGDETAAGSSGDDATDAPTEPGVAVDTGAGGLDPEAGDWPDGPDRDDHEYDANRGRWPEPDDVSHPVHGEGDAEAPWPEVVEDDDEGFDAEAGGESPADVEFGGGLTPQRRRGTAADDDPDTPDPRTAPGEDEPAEDAEDAELIDDTELNEQSEVTAEAPVDPATRDGQDDADPPGDEAIDELMEKTAERPAEGESSGADATDSATRAGDADPRTDTGIARPDPSPSERAGGDRSRPGTRRAEPLGELDSPVTEYHCPECGYTEASASSSLRAGDICPECRRGYLGERDQ